MSLHFFKTNGLYLPIVIDCTLFLCLFLLSMHLVKLLIIVLKKCAFLLNKVIWFRRLSNYIATDLSNTFKSIVC